MKRIGFWRLIGLLGVCLALVPVSASAWELQMAGAMNWTYEFYNQRGSQGFFGPYNVDNGAGTRANQNYWWNGARLALPIVTGADASRSYFYCVFDPTVTITPAVKLRGRMRLGQWNQNQYSYYFTQDAPGTDNAFTEGQWTMFWATIAMPWGNIGIGKRPWKFGNGLQYDGSDGLTTETLLLDVPFGPFDLGIGFYPHRPARAGQTGLGLYPGVPFDPYNLVAAPYFNHADKSGVISKDLVGYLIYNSGCLQTGVLASGSSFHIGPEAALVLDTAAPALAQDSDFFHGTVFAKYFNGRFFLNAEAAWLYWKDRLSGIGVFPGNLAPGGFLPNPRYTEQWRYMIEAGTVAGPAKVALLFAWTPGPDRRNGALIGKQSGAFVWHSNFDNFLGNYDVFRPYSFIFTYNYGAGFNAYNLSLDGYLRDAWVLGGRFDYSIASNLNAYGTFMWAERTSTGYAWGCIAPDGTGNIVFGLNGTVNGVVNALNVPNTIPNIPDTGLGWEVNTGVDWKLLEGWTAGVLVGYWQPGKWFSYACVDRSVPGWNAPAAGNFYGTRPGKHIDPIVAGQVTMSFAF